MVGMSVNVNRMWESLRHNGVWGYLIEAFEPLLNSRSVRAEEARKRCLEALMQDASGWKLRSSSARTARLLNP